MRDDPTGQPELTRLPSGAEACCSSVSHWACHGVKSSITVMVLSPLLQYPKLLQHTHEGESRGGGHQRGMERGNWGPFNTKQAHSYLEISTVPTRGEAPLGAIPQSQHGPKCHQTKHLSFL